MTRMETDMAFNFLEDSADFHQVSYSLPECMEDDLQTVFLERKRSRMELKRLKDVLQKISEWNNFNDQDVEDMQRFARQALL